MNVKKVLNNIKSDNIFYTDFKQNVILIEH